MPRKALTGLIEICHRHGVLVSTGGFIEYLLGQGSDAAEAYIQEAKDAGFDIIELSSGFISISAG